MPSGNDSHPLPHILVDNWFVSLHCPSLLSPTVVPHHCPPASIKHPSPGAPPHSAFRTWTGRSIIATSSSFQNSSLLLFIAFCSLKDNYSLFLMRPIAKKGRNSACCWAVSFVWAFVECTLTKILPKCPIFTGLWILLMLLDHNLHTWIHPVDAPSLWRITTNMGKTGWVAFFEFVKFHSYW